MLILSMKKLVKSNYFSKILLYSIIPWTIILLSFIGIYQFMLVKYESEIIMRYDQTNQALVSELDLIFSGAAHTGYVLINSPSFDKIERKNPGQDIFNSSMGELIELRTLFSDTAIINDIIESLFLFFPNAGRVLHSMGTESEELFFSTTNRLEDYPAEFWRAMTPGNYSYHILNPTIKKKDTPQETRVIPVIIPKQSSGYFITMLLREDFIKQVLKNHLITANTIVSINTPDGKSIITTDSSTSAEKNDGWQYQETSLFLGDQLFTLTTAFPRSDIIALTYDIRLIMIVSTLLLALLSSFISYLLSRNVSKPVEGLIELMKKKASQESVDSEGIQFLQKGVENLLISSETLNRNLTDITPIAIENYMERLILDHKTANPWLIMKKLKTYGFDFPYPQFQIILVHLDPSEQLFTKLTQDDISLFYQGAMDLITHGFPDTVSLWQIGFEEHTIRILLNSPPKIVSNSVIPYLKSFISIFNQDTNLKNIAIGVGTIYTGVEFIHTSYTEAHTALVQASKDQPNSVLLYTNEKFQQEFILPEQDIIKLSEDLLLGKSEQVFQQLDEILLANKSIDIPDKTMMKLFFRIYLIIQQVLQTKNLKEAHIMGSSYKKIPLQYNNLTSEVFLSYINSLITAATKTILPVSTHKIEKNDISDYLEENFSKDISLDDLAERYNTTPVYVSKCIKKLFGVPLTSYLAEKRISFASYLLTETNNLSIEEIAVICGYNNRIHFTRSFKQRRGVPPTEYRKNASS